MKVVLFGNREFASLAWYALTHDSPHEVVGFTVDRAFLTTPTHHGLPVIAFDELAARFPPSEAALLLPIGDNRLREGKYTEARALGYRFVSYVSSRAITWPDLELGDCSMIFEGAIVQPFAKMGRGVIVRSGCHVSHHVTIGDFSFLAAYTVTGGMARIGARCFLGLNSVVRDNISIADGCTIGAGAVVCEETLPDRIYVGLPAKSRPQSDPRPRS